MQKYLFSAVFLLFTNAGICQFVFEAVLDIPISSDSSQYSFAWAGGLNNPQFSEIDLDLDGLKDLLVFDRNGGKFIHFIRNNQDSLELHLSFDHISYLPKTINWLLTADYNCDLKNDLFTYNEIGIAVYRNISSSTLEFKPYNKGKNLRSDYGSGEVNLLVSGNDIPAIADIDGDGDLDILTFSFFSGDLIEYHQNQSVELYGTCDSLKFALVDACWGKVQENTFDNILTLGIMCKGASSINQTIGARHIGSTLTLIDRNFNGIKDLLVGDISFQQMTLLRNSGDSSSAMITSQDPDFPNYDVSVGIDIFPAAFYVDVDHDGKKDLVIAPNSLNSEDKENSWLYLDKGNDSAEFRFQQNTFLTASMVDVGTSAYPSLFDYNYDQLPDLIIGNGYRFSTQLAQLDVYANQGSVGNPDFRLLREDIGNVSATGWKFVNATFGDLDDDDDMDMIVGNDLGEIHHFEHFIGIVPEPVFVQNDTILNSGIDIGSYATPQLFDLNRDSLLDLLIGESNGRVNYYENTGSKTSANFTLVTSYLGNVDVSGAQANGYSTPHAFWQDGKIYLLVGSEDGKFFLFDNVNSNPGTIFNLLSDDLLMHNIGSRTSAFVWDYNTDGKPDLVCGNSSGGLNLFKGSNFSSFDPIEESYRIKLYPNPADGYIHYHFKEKHVAMIYDAAGRLVHKTTAKGDNTISLEDFKAGIYFLVLKSAKGIWYEKIILN